MEIGMGLKSYLVFGAYMFVHKYKFLKQFLGFCFRIFPSIKFKNEGQGIEISDKAVVDYTIQFENLPIAIRWGGSLV